MPTYYPADVVKDVQALLDTPPSVQPIGTSFKKIMNIFKAHGIVKAKRRLHCKLLLPHPKNRSGIMINGFNSRANGSKVANVGANINELHGAVAIELSPFPDQQQHQIGANKKLADNSKGLIPPPNGDEEWLTLGTSHMCMFIRCVLAGLKACFKNLSDANGMLSMELLRQDPDFKVMIEEGWDWLILPWQCENTWPNLPEFAQRALNASNSVANDATEWEIAVSMGECWTQMSDPNWQLAKEASAAGEPSCKGYLDAICTIVQKYGGGAPDFSLIREQEAFYKTLGAHKRLGETFTKAVADTKLDYISPRLHVRHALITLNLTSNKLEDGVAKLVFKSHVAALSGKDMNAVVETADDNLGAARDFLFHLQQADRISDSQFTDLLGMLRVRYGGFLTKLGKNTFEGITYEAPIQIISKFLKEAKAAIDEYSPNGNTAVAIPLRLRPALMYEEKPSAQQAEATKKNKALTIAEANSLGHRAEESGFSVGSMVQMGKSHDDHVCGLYKIESVGEEVKVVEVDAFKDASDLQEHHFKFADFLKKWQEFKGDVQIPVSGYWNLPVFSFKASVELHKANLFRELFDLIKQNEDPPLNQLIMPTFKPAGIRALRDCKKGDIVLYPVCTSAAQISVVPSATAAKIITSLRDPKNNELVSFYISGVAKPNSELTSDWREAQGVSPLNWLVEDAEPNMVHKKFESSGFMIPYCENTKALKRYQRLTVAKGSLKRKANEI